MNTIKTCSWSDCTSMVEGRTEYCATHGHLIRKQERESLKVKVVKPIRKVSVKRSSEEKEYQKLRKEYLEAYSVCEVVECHRKSVQIHHMQGRTNDLLCDVNNFLAVCDVCHQRITVDSKWAIENGYSILRSI